MADRELIMPGIRYILSSMIYSRNLVSKLKRLGCIDTLTGVGNRVSLQEHLEQLDHGKAMSVICVDVIGWDDAEGKLPHLEREQTLLRAGEVLTNLYSMIPSRSSGWPRGNSSSWRTISPRRNSRTA